MVTGLWVQPFLIFGRIVPRGVIGAIYVSTGTFWAKSIFFKKPKKPFLSETGQNILSYFYQSFRGTIVKNALFPSWRTLSKKWFSRENFHFRCFVWTLSGKNPARSSKNGLRWQKSNWGKWFLLRMIWISILLPQIEQNFQDFGRKISTGMLILQSPPRDDQLPEKHLFFRINYQFQNILSFWGRRVWTFSEKKSWLSELHLTCPVAKLYEKMFFLDSSQFYTFVRTVTATHSEVRLKNLLWVLQTALYVSK